MSEKEKDKKVIIFDLDGTLTKSKSILDEEMAALLRTLLQKKKVAVTSGGKFEQFEKQFLGHLNASEEELASLYILPTSGAQMYYRKRGWKKAYGEELSLKERRKITNAFDKILKETGLEVPEEIYGEQIEDRGAQITFSALGQEAPLAVKKGWDPEHKKREKMQIILEKRLPEYQIQIGGTTSIDITHKDIDKGYGVLQLKGHLKMDVEDMLFIGDSLFEGGNDYTVRRTGIQWIEVRGPEETKEVIRSLINT